MKTNNKGGYHATRKITAPQATSEKEVDGVKRRKRLDLNFMIKITALEEVIKRILDLAFLYSDQIIEKLRTIFEYFTQFFFVG